MRIPFRFLKACLKKPTPFCWWSVGVATAGVLTLSYTLQVRQHQFSSEMPGESNKVPVGKPILRTGQDTYDAGIVIPGSSVHWTFTIENLGDADLLLTDLETSCGCSHASLSSNTIKPADSQVLHLSVTFPHDEGPTTQAVFLKTNAPESPQLTLRLRANCQWPIQATPADIVLDHVHCGKAYSTHLELSSRGQEFFDIIDIRTSSPIIKFQSLSTHSNRYSFKVIVEPKNSGLLAETITFVTNSNRAEITVSIRAWAK